MATLTLQATDEDGINPLTETAAAAGGDQFINDGRQIIVVQNGDASAKTVTVAGQATDVRVPHYGKLDQTDTVAVVAAGATAILGPFPKQGFNDASGYVQITYSAVTSVTVGVVTVPRS